MDQAIIFADGKGIDDVELRQFTNTKLVGVNQLTRLIIIAQRSGISKFIIVSNTSDIEFVNRIVKDKRINAEIQINGYGIPFKLDSKPYLVLQSNLVITGNNISRLIGSQDFDYSSVDEHLLLIDRSDDKYVKISEDYVEDGFIECGKIIGAFVSHGKELQKLVDSSTSIDFYLQDRIKSQKTSYVDVLEEGYWYHLRPNRDSVKIAEKILFSNVGKTATGWISRNINSKFSLPTSSMLVKTPLTPNMISVLINFIGVLSGPFLALGHPVLGAFFMHIATILDRCDGEVARVKLMETKKGQWVDTVSDQFTVLSFFIGLSIGYYSISKGILPIALGIFNLFVLIFFLSWSFYYLANYTGSGSLVTYFTIDKYNRGDCSIIRKIILFLRPMSRRNFYSMGFLMISIIGGYPWMLGFLSFAMLLFFIHLVEDIFNIRKYGARKIRV